MIRVLIVDDSLIAQHILKRLLARAADIQVVGTAQNGREALPMVASLRPDVICIDLHMPVMNGLEFTRAVMSTDPRPILVVSVSVQPGTPGVFKLLEAGAVDVLPKPALFEAEDDKFAIAFIAKVRVVAGVRVFRRTSAPHSGHPVNVEAQRRAPARLGVIGASTGGPQALWELLGALPPRFSLPLVCVQHIGKEFLPEMVAWIAEATPLTVRTAQAGELPGAGHVYFASADSHLEFDSSGHFLLTHSAPYDGHRPSVTVTMKAAAQQYGAGTVGVLLTGMGRDGAEGMASIARAGGLTIAQDEASSVIYGMPRAAVALGAVQHVLPLGQIASALMALAKGSGAALSGI